MEKKNKALTATFAAAALGAAALVTVASGANAATVVDNTTPVFQQDQTTASEPVGTETSDGTDVGPDANPNETGHQDADDATETAADNESADNAGEVETGVEGADDVAGSVTGN